MKRGRKSTEELATARSPVTVQHRPDADYSLTDEQSEVWDAVIQALPAGWIGPEALPLLTAYCRTTTALRRLGQLITQAETAAEPFDPAAYAALLRAHAGQAQVLKTLGTSLRLTPQSRLRAEVAASRRDGYKSGARPWEWKA